MLCPDKKDYLALAEEYDVVPLYREVLADTETPVSVLQRFAECENVFLLESMEGGRTWGRYSFVGVDPELLLESDHSAGPTGDLTKLRDAFRGLKVAEIEGLPRFCGGIVGFFGYESVGEFERLPIPRESVGQDVPRSRFLRADKVVVFDNVRHTVKIVVCTKPAEFASPEEAYAKAMSDIDDVACRMAAPGPGAGRGGCAPRQRAPPPARRPAGRSTARGCPAARSRASRGG